MELTGICARARRTLTNQIRKAIQIGWNAETAHLSLNNLLGHLTETQASLPDGRLRKRVEEHPGYLDWTPTTGSADYKITQPHLNTRSPVVPAMNGLDVRRRLSPAGCMHGFRNLPLCYPS